MSEAAGLSAKHEPPGSNAKASYNEPGSVTTELCLIIHSHREREVERGGERRGEREGVSTLDRSKNRLGRDRESVRGVA